MPADELLYGDLAFFHTHPSHIAIVAALCGKAPPPVATARVLEIACGTGFNLLAMSQTLPAATLVGVDLSEPQIRHGQAAVNACGVTNLSLHVGRLEDIDESWGQFDYIIAHGIFTWVPLDVRQRLLTVYKERLAPGGIGYLSWNTLPGWGSRRHIRELLRLFDPLEGSAADRMHAAKTAFEQFMTTLPVADDLYAQTLKDEFSKLDGEADYYLFHEYLVNDNHPLTFTEFASLLQANGLQFLAESRTPTNTFAQRGDDAKALAPAGDDLIRREQLHDYRWQRYFRQSLVCHADEPITRTPDAMALARGWVSPRVELVEPLNDYDSTDQDTVRREEDGATFDVYDPLMRKFLRRMKDSPGQCLPASAFVKDVQDMVNVPIPPQAVWGFLSKVLTVGIYDEVWHVYAAEPKFAKTLGDRPKACPVAQWKAARETSVTNRLHRSCTLTAEEIELLLKCDGTRTVDELTAAPGVLERLLAKALLDA